MKKLKVYAISYKSLENLNIETTLVFDNKAEFINTYIRLKEKPRIIGLTTYSGTIDKIDLDSILGGI